MTDAAPGLALLALLVLPAILIHLLRRTPVFWLPGAALGVLGLIAFANMPSTHEDVGGMSAMAAGVMAIAGMCLIAYGAICLVISAWLHARATRVATAPVPPSVELPPAVVVSEVSKT